MVVTWLSLIQQLEKELFSAHIIKEYVKENSNWRVEMMQIHEFQISQLLLVKGSGRCFREFPPRRPNLENFHEDVQHGFVSQSRIRKSTKKIEEMG